jgi:2-haloacid dehalogenase
MTDSQVKLEGVQAVVFDAYGTLFDVNSPVNALANELGEKASALAPLWRQKQLEYTWLRSLMGVHTDFWHVTRDALDFALLELNIEDKEIADALMAAYLQLDPYPEVADSLSALRKSGRRLAILSNGSPSMLDAIVRHAKFEKSFEHVISVEEVGIYKPSRRVYRLAMQKFHIADTPSICFVSANTWDAQAAAQFGFQVVRVQRTPKNDDRIPGRPARLVHDLTELSALL